MPPRPPHPPYYPDERDPSEERQGGGGGDPAPGESEEGREEEEGEERGGREYVCAPLDGCGGGDAAWDRRGESSSGVLLAGDATLPGGRGRVVGVLKRGVTRRCGSVRA